MIEIDVQGMLTSARVIPKRYSGIEHGTLAKVCAVVVHQTDTATAQQVFNGYLTGGNGAHFLIDRDGRIYQTASVKRRCFHVGRYIKSKCMSVDVSTCNRVDIAKLKALSGIRWFKAADAIERAKAYPHRYPINSDSIGIELVGKHLDDTDTYELVSKQQNAALQWLLDGLYAKFALVANDVYRHPQISYKNPAEASTASWR